MSIATVNEDQSRIEELESLIQYHSDLYYNEGTPEITDAEFDELWDELKTLKPDSEVLQAVGALTKGTGNKLTHKTLMGSLTKVKSKFHLNKWINKDTTPLAIGARQELSLTPKIDGLAIRLNYRKGALVEAATRGDGSVGQDVLANVLEIDDIPKKTDQGFSGEIRGEIYMKKSTFEKLRKNGLTFANPRNAASGSLMQKDPKKTGERELSFFAYDIIYDDDCEQKQTFHFEHEKFWALGRLSDITPVPQKRIKVEALDKILYDWEHNKRDNLDYDIDGLVLGWCSLAAQEDAGWNGKRPRGKVAWKFMPEQKIATVEGIDWQVGRTGKLTPVARISATQLAGTCVQNVTLHNYEFVNNNSLKPGDKILVEKAGEIIPHIVSVVEQVDGEASVPTTCPCCGGSVFPMRMWSNLYCRNPSCSAQLSTSVEHYLDRIGCLGIGPSTVKGLVACGAVTDLSDLYFMSADDIRGVTGSETMTKKMLNTILEKDELPLATFLSALGIHTLGRTTSKLLAKEFRSLQAIRDVSVVRLQALEGIGSTSANAIVAGMHNMEDVIDRILEAIDVVDVEDATGPLAGMSFCLTGSMSRPRKAIAADIEAAGGEVRSSVGKGLTYLIMADSNCRFGITSSTSSKSKKAKANGTEVIGEDKLMEMMA